MPLLDTLRQYAQFVAVQLSPDPARPGKTKKMPIDPKTGGAASSTDPSTWGTYEQAFMHGVSVGFVLTENDPLFVIDIDDGKEHPILSSFPGAIVETSQSGNGRHIWGAYTSIPAHRCKSPIDKRLELYHTARFICLGTEESGQLYDWTAHLPAIVEQWYKPLAGDGVPQEWTDGPCPEWRGSTDDAELIRRARSSRSAAGVFGGKASFDDLWQGQYDGHYPGASEADAALAQHLAFWTGRDCARIEQLMWQSGLVRDKWTDHATYLEITILNAVAQCREVCVDKAVPYEPSAVTPQRKGHYMPEMGTRGGDVIVSPHQYGDVFKGCVYVRNKHKVFVPGTPTLFTPEQFKVRYGGIRFMETDGKAKRDAWAAFTDTAEARPPEVSSVIFRPDLPHGAIVNVQGELFVNTYQPADVDSVKGDVSPFLIHLAKLLPVERDRAILLAYMAAIVQYPGRKFAWAPLIQGAEGNGKSFFNAVVKEAVGHRFTHMPTRKQLEKEFNSWMAGKIFVYVEDVMIRRDLMEDLKTTITADAQSIEAKGVDAEMTLVCCNFIFNANHKHAYPKGKNDRRIAPFFTAQQTREDIARDSMDGNYFPTLWDWARAGGYAAITHYLRSYPIPDEFNPAKLCQRAPDTSSTLEAIEASLGGVEQDIIEAVEAGHVGFRGGWISTHFVTKMFESKISPMRMRDILESIGYVAHPGLDRGRVNNIVLPDNVKPRLYIRAGSGLENLTGAANIAKVYTEAQMSLS